MFGADEKYFPFSRILSVSFGTARGSNRAAVPAFLGVT